MGSLTYDGVRIEFEDRVLTHVQIVIAAKLRRGEAFVMTWRDANSVGDGHSAIWLHPSIPLYFKYHGSRGPAVNPDWLEELKRSADSAHGLHVLAEENSSKEIPADKTGPRPPMQHTVVVPD